MHGPPSTVAARPQTHPNQHSPFVLPQTEASGNVIRVHCRNTLQAPACRILPVALPSLLTFAGGGDAQAGTEALLTNLSLMAVAAEAKGRRLFNPLAPLLACLGAGWGCSISWKMKVGFHDSESAVLDSDVISLSNVRVHKCSSVCSTVALRNSTSCMLNKLGSQVFLTLDPLLLSPRLQGTDEQG